MAAVRLLDEPRPFCLRAALRRSHDLRYRVRFPSNHAHTLSSHHEDSLLPLCRHSATASRPAHSIAVVCACRLNPRVAAGAERSPYTRRSEEHTSELQSLMRTSYAVFCLKK